MQSFKTGIGNIYENIGGSAQWASQIAFGQEYGESLAKYGESMQTPSRSVEDIRGRGIFFNLAINQLFEQGPQFGFNILGRAVGSVGGAAVGALGGPGTAAGGAVVGMTAASALQNVGESYRAAKAAGNDPDQAALIAGVTGPLKTLLDIIEPTREAGRVGQIWKDVLDVKLPLGQTIARGAKAVGKEALVGGGTEAGTESVQEILDIAGEQAARDWKASQLGVPSTSPGFAQTLS